jgi:ketosteroid isomerase-like protein
MKKLLLACVLATFTGGALRAAEPAPAAAITTLLEQQAMAWNRADIDGFMTAYAKTNDLRFASGGKVTYGWQATRDGYKKRYPDKTAMGVLTFTELVITPLAPDAALAFGRWKLSLENGSTPNGLFTLTLKKTAEGWRITQDHTSSAGP